MNKLKFSILSILLVQFLLGCGGSDGDDSPDEAALLQSGTWKMQTVTVDDMNRNDLFTGFTISFSAKGFTSTHGEPVWPASGTWTFADASHRSITRNDATVITLETLSETALTLRMQWNKTTLDGGRNNSVAGTHVFVLGK